MQTPRNRKVARRRMPAVNHAGFTFFAVAGRYWQVPALQVSPSLQLVPQAALSTQALPQSVRPPQSMAWQAPA